MKRVAWIVLGALILGSVANARDSPKAEVTGY